MQLQLKNKQFNTVSGRLVNAASRCRRYQVCSLDPAHSFVVRHLHYTRGTQGYCPENGWGQLCLPSMTPLSAAGTGSNETRSYPLGYFMQ